MIRSFLSVFPGFAMMAVLVAVATGIAFQSMLEAPDPRRATSSKPTPAYLAVHVAYSAIFAALGGFVTAWIAPRLPLYHVLALALLMAVLSVGSFFQASSRQQPSWSRWVLLGWMPTCALLGGDSFVALAVARLTP